LPDPVESAGYVMEALQILHRELDGDAALLGFAGAPFTLASYLVEERPGPAAARFRTLLRTDPGAATALLEKVARATALYLTAQVDAGAEAIQIFDTRAGCLAESEFREHALPWARFLVEELAGRVPVIYFVLETPHLLKAAVASGADVLGVDWRVPLGEARRIVGPGRAVQGNLDPAVPFASPEVIASETRRVLREAGPEPGHIFNLGHGVLPHTPPEGLAEVIRVVRDWDGS
jgi:uroporphyrinogen decarboxylase